MEVRACMRYLVRHPQPSYLRLGKAGEPCFHADVPELQPGRWLPVAGSAAAGPGPAACLLSTGAALGIAMSWREREAYRQHQVLSMPLWSMAAKAEQALQAQAWQEIVTLEDHLVDGGFGSWLLEALPAGAGARERLRSLALSPQVCGTVGSQAMLNELGGLAPPPG